MARLRKKNILPILKRLVLVAILAGITFLFARGALRMFGRYEEASSASSAAKAELSDLQAKKITLEEDTNRLGSGRGLEEELRKRYGVALPGEGVIEIASQPGTTSKEGGPSMMDRWLNWLF